MRYGMVIDLRRCVGCDACTVACKVSNGTPAGVFFSHVDNTVEGTYPNAVNVYLPVLCNQCAKPACVPVCPVQASYVGENGIVYVNQDLCIGCGSCVSACPYGARTVIAKPKAYFGEQGLTAQEENLYARFNENCAYKCDFCYSKGYCEDEAGTACVRTCPAQARIFGDLDDPESRVAQLVAEGVCQPLNPEAGTEPQVYYIPRF